MPITLWPRIALLAALFLAGAASGAWGAYKFAVRPLQDEKAASVAVAQYQSERNLSLTLKAQNDQLANQKDIARLRADSAAAWARLRQRPAGAGAVPDVHADSPDERPAPDGSEGSCSQAAEPAIAAAVAQLMADDALEIDLTACRRDLRACASVCR